MQDMHSAALRFLRAARYDTAERRDPGGFMSDLGAVDFSKRWVPRQALEPGCLCGAGPPPLRCTSLIPAVTHNLALLGRWHMQLVSGIFQRSFYLLYYILIYNYIYSAFLSWAPGILAKIKKYS